MCVLLFMWRCSAVTVKISSGFICEHLFLLSSEIQTSGPLCQERYRRREGGMGGGGGGEIWV